MTTFLNVLGILITVAGFLAITIGSAYVVMNHMFKGGSVPGTVVRLLAGILLLAVFITICVELGAGQ